MPWMARTWMRCDESIYGFAKVPKDKLLQWQLFLVQWIRCVNWLLSRQLNCVVWTDGTMPIKRSKMKIIVRTSSMHAKYVIENVTKTHSAPMPWRRDVFCIFISRRREIVGVSSCENSWLAPVLRTIARGTLNPAETVSRSRNYKHTRIVGWALAMVNVMASSSIFRHVD